MTLADWLPSFLVHAVELVFAVMAITLLAGLIARCWIFERDKDDAQRVTGKEPERPKGYQSDRPSAS
jgi:hypothetical protein